MSAIRLPVRRIIAAVDFEDHWENMVGHAAAFATRHDADLHLVHVVRSPGWLLRKVLDEKGLAAHLDDLLSTARQRIEAHAATLEGIRVHVRVDVGKPSVAVRAALEELNADLLVLGVAAETRGTVALLGGTAGRLLRMSPIPVYISGPYAPGPIGEVLVPTGLGPGGRAAIEVAAGLVSDSGTVCALHMVRLPSVMRSYSGDVMALRRKLAAKAQEELDAHVASAEVPSGSTVESMLVTDLEVVPADATIVRVAREREAQTICLAVGGRSLAQGLIMGGVTERVIRTLPCALLALPDAWVAKGR